MPTNLSTAPPPAPNAVYVENLYEVLLNRFADPAGLANFTTQLNGGTPPSSVILEIEGSSEFLADQARLQYLRYLNRAPSPTELNGFVDLLVNSGHTLEQAAAFITSSPEYLGDYGNYNPAYVQSLYVNVLNRIPAPAEQANWVQMLNSGALSPNAATTVFFSSSEYDSNLVQSDFQAFLGRPAEASSVATFVNLLQTGTTSLQVAADILGSTEAYNNRS